MSLIYFFISILITTVFYFWDPQISSQFLKLMVDHTIRLKTALKKDCKPN